MFQLMFMLVVNKDAIPNIRRIFAMFDPMTPPNTISEEFWSTAIREVMSSGKLVPKATIVTPMTNGGIDNHLPNSSEASINISEDLISTKSEAISPSESKIKSSCCS